MSGYDVAQLARLEPAYQERLGLTTAPFPPTHEDRFLYLDADRLQRLNMLQHLTEYSNLLLLVVGERGIGKTSLMQRFIAEAKPEWRLCEVNANTMMDADQLLFDIARGFGLPAPPRDAAALQDALYRQLVKLRQSETIPILIVDDAHELPQDALEALFHLADTESSEGNLLRIILFCEPQIETMLEQPAIQALRGRITHTVDIPPLTEEQTAEYLRHRLAVAGLRTPNPFSLRDVRHIYKVSGGVPAHINEAAHMLLSEGAGTAEEAGGKGFRFPAFRPAHLLIALAGIVLLGVLLFQNVFNDLFEETPPSAEIPIPPPRPAAQPAPRAQTPKAETAPAEAAPAKTAQPGTIMRQSEDKTPAAVPGTTQPPVPADTKTAQARSAAETAAGETPPSQPPIPRIDHITPNPVTGSRKPQTLTLHGEGFSKESRVEVRWQQGAKILDKAQVEWRNDKELRLTLTTGINPDTWQVVVQSAGQSSQAARFDVKAPAEKQQPKTAASPAKLWDTVWIRRQPGHHVTLQLLSSRQRSGIERFVKQHGLQGLAVAFESRQDGHSLYSLILGSYPDRKQASQAITQLPASLKKIKPWTRDFRTIQALLKTTQRTQKQERITNTPPPRSQHRIDQTAWLWSQDPSHYTLQLMSGYNEAGIRQFISQHKLIGKAVYFRTHRDGRNWYALLYGSYPSREAARAAIKKLPPAVRKARPWARRFSSIHAELPPP